METRQFAGVWSGLQDKRVWPGLLSGAAAGAAGTTALNVITYLDIAVRGRPTSSTPERTVEAMARLFGLTVPGSGDVLAHRLSGLGALTGYAAGIGMGVILGLAYALGWRPGLLVATLVASAIALVGTNGPMTVLGVTDPLDLEPRRLGQRPDSASRVRDRHRPGVALPRSALRAAGRDTFLGIALAAERYWDR